MLRCPLKLHRMHVRVFGPGLLPAAGGLCQHGNRLQIVTLSPISRDSSASCLGVARAGCVMRDRRRPSPSHNNVTALNSVAVAVRGA
jgi:hypothetical protein